MDSAVARTLNRETFERLFGRHPAAITAFRQWTAGDLRPYAARKKPKPEQLRAMLAAYDTRVAEPGLSPFFHESDEKVLGSRFHERGVVRGCTLFAASRNVEWKMARDDELIGDERTFYGHSIGFIARKSKFLAYRTTLPFHLTGHAMQRLLERSDMPSAAAFFGEDLLRSLVFISPLCITLRHPECKANRSAMALPYRHGLLLAMRRCLTVSEPADSERFRYAFDRNGRLRKTPIPTALSFFERAHINTYVDYQQMSRGQEHLLRVLNEFHDTFRDDLWRLFCLEHFLAAVTEGDEQAVLGEADRLYRYLGERLLPVVNHQYWTSTVNEPKQNWLNSKQEMILQRRSSENKPVAV